MMIEQCEQNILASVGRLVLFRKDFTIESRLCVGKTPYREGGFAIEVPDGWDAWSEVALYNGQTLFLKAIKRKKYQWYAVGISSASYALHPVGWLCDKIISTITYSKGISAMKIRLANFFRAMLLTLSVAGLTTSHPDGSPAFAVIIPSMIVLVLFAVANLPKCVNIMEGKA